MPLPDITTEDDIKTLVDTFYTRVQADDLIGPIFNHVALVDWPKHLETMYSFWGSLLLNQHTYRGNAFAKHAPLPISQPHFNRWLALFNTTVDDYFAGPVADDAKARAQSIGSIFAHKLAYKHQVTP